MSSIILVGIYEQTFMEICASIHGNTIYKAKTAETSYAASMYFLQVVFRNSSQASVLCFQTLYFTNEI